MDGCPLPLCVLTRAPRCRVFAGEADYGYCAAKKPFYIARKVLAHTLGIFVNRLLGRLDLQFDGLIA